MSTRRFVGREAGYTLVELIGVMVILGIIIAALTTLFVSGTRAELNANHLFQAQQNARLALDRIRRELHCASAVSSPNGVPVTSVTVTLPAGCPPTEISVTYSTQLVSANRWQLRRGSLVVADYLTNDDVFTYYVPASGTLGRLRVDFPVNIRPAEGFKEWRLIDDIVLRNTTRL